MEGEAASLVVAGNGTVMGCPAIGEIEHHVFDIAPPPSFGRIIAFNDGMAGRMKMLCRMPAGRLVAASDMPARATNPEMKPSVACLETLLAAKRARRHVANRAQMGTGLRHGASPR